MTIEQIKEAPLQTILEALQKSDTSLRDIAKQLHISPASVSLIINKKYKGSRDTAERVYQKIFEIISGRENLNHDIYSNMEPFFKLLQLGVNSNKFSIPEKEVFISLHKKLDAYKQKTIS